MLSWSVVSNSLQPNGLSPPDSCPWEFSRQEYWSGLPRSTPEDLPDPGTESESYALQADSLPAELVKVSPELYATTVYLTIAYFLCWGFPGGSDGKESPCNVGDLGSIHGLGRSPGGGHGNPVRYSGPENLMDREAWQAIAHGVTELDLTEQLSTAHRENH